ncbi:MAG: hypothetical protein JXR95_11995 [Deltaproteobacteria bacterium]|nr:hypothetical protein [Deltaproteobacteria bacterium]
MKKILLITGLILTASPAYGKGKTHTATARINRKCQSERALINIPPGSVAKNFKLLSLSSGTKCVVGGFFNYKGFSIKKNGVILYSYTKSRGKITEKGGSLKNLKLYPGKYWLYVGGGNGAKASLKYELKGKKIK